MVDVKLFSRWRSEDSRVFRRVSAAEVWACRKRRAWRIWVARRSVGVGEVDDEPGVEGLEVGFGGRVGRVS